MRRESKAGSKALSFLLAGVLALAGVPVQALAEAEADASASIAAVGDEVVIADESEPADEQMPADEQAASDAVAEVVAPSEQEADDGSADAEPTPTPEPTADSDPVASPDPTLEEQPAPAAQEDAPAKDASQPDQAPELTEDEDLAAEPADDALEAQAVSGTWGTCPWDINAQGVLTVHPGTGAENDTSKSPWDAYESSITSIKLVAEKGKKVILPKSSRAIFNHLSQAASIDMSGADSSHVEDMYLMFAGCHSLVSLSLPGFVTSSTKNLTGMFSGCYNLAKLDVSGWDTSSVTAANTVFWGCSKLTSLDVSGWDTSEFRYMTGMFESCNKLAELDVSRWNTSHVLSMESVFAGCWSLTSLDLSRWKTSNVGNMSEMFYGCSKLETLKVNSWDTSSVKDMSGMFHNCSSLVSLNLSNWNTAKVTDMEGMFEHCKRLTSIDMTGWDTSSVGHGDYVAGSMDDMFSDCYKLAMFKVGKKYKPVSAAGIPAPLAADINLWQATSDNALYTKDEIATKRAGIADMYRLVKGFPDVKAGTWYHKVVVRAAMLGLVSGYENGNFGPDANVTRGQAAVMLWNMAGRPKAGKAAKDFPDVASDAFYYQAVRWASSAGVVNGYAAGTFGPNDKVTREQLATMLANYAKRVAKQNVDGSKADYASMKDANTVAGYAQQAVGWCFKNQILTGTSGGKISPKGNATRAQAAKMLVALYDLVQ